MRQHTIKPLPTGWFHMNWGNIMSPVAAGDTGPAILNPGDIMRTLGKLDLMADMVVPGHDAELLNMKVIPDDYPIE